MPELFGGVETGGTWCVCAVGTGPEHITSYDQFRTGEPEETLERIIAFFARCDTRPVAIGVGSFGPVDPDPASPSWGYVTTTPKPGWQHTAVAPALRDRLRVPVAFDSDVNVAALGEYRWGAGRDAQSLCYLTVGTGIGAGLLIGRRPWHGLVHPEVGHVRIPRVPGDAFQGDCPTHGDCWEGLAAGGAIAKRWGTRGQDLPDDHPAWPLEAEYLALGILSIVLVASPHRVIVGGGVMERTSLLPMIRERVRDLLAGYLDVPLLRDEIDRFLVAPELGDRAGVLGAIALAQLA